MHLSVHAHALHVTIARRRTAYVHEGKLKLLCAAQLAWPGTKDVCTLAQVHADNICVIKSGRLVEQGQHGDLMEARGVYAALVARQMHKTGSSTSLTAGLSRPASSAQLHV